MIDPTLGQVPQLRQQRIHRCRTDTIAGNEASDQDFVGSIIVTKYVFRWLLDPGVLHSSSGKIVSYAFSLHRNLEA